MTQVAPPGEAVTVVVVGAGDPVGTVTVAPPLPGVPVGAPGVPGMDASGWTVAESGDAGEVPVGFSATAVNVYGMPFVSPGTKQEVAGNVITQVALPGEAVTVVVVGAGDPVGTVTVTDPLCATPVGVPGVPGMDANGVVGVDPGDVSEVPDGFSATAVNV